MERWGEYDLTPITVRPNGQADLDEDHALRKRHIRFRTVGDLRGDVSDRDAAALAFLRYDCASSRLGTRTSGRERGRNGTTRAGCREKAHRLTFGPAG